MYYCEAIEHHRALLDLFSYFKPKLLISVFKIMYPQYSALCWSIGGTAVKLKSS